MPPGGNAHCGHCMTLVENKKYACERCSCLLCPTHRGRDSKHIFKTVYFCLGNCPPLVSGPLPPSAEPVKQPVSPQPASSKPSSAAAASSTPDATRRHSNPPAPPVEYYSVQAKRQEPESGLAAFGNIRLSSPSPSRPSTSDSARPVTTSFGIIHTDHGPAEDSSSWNRPSAASSSSRIAASSRPPLHRVHVSGSGGDEPQPVTMYDGGGEDVGGDLASRFGALDASSVRSPKRLQEHNNRRESGDGAGSGLGYRPQTGPAQSGRPATTQGPPPVAGVVIGGTPQFTAMHNPQGRLTISSHGSRSAGSISRGGEPGSLFDLGPTSPVAPAPPAEGTVIGHPAVGTVVAYSSTRPPTAQQQQQPVQAQEFFSGIALDVNRGAPVQPLPLVNIGSVFPTPEPIDPASGERQVALGRNDIRLIQGEPRMKFAEVLFKSGRLARGVILGYIESNSHTVWHERGEKYGQILLPAEVESTTSVQAAKCKHCGAIVSKDEALLHVDTHKVGGGVDAGTRVNSDTLGTACGDTALLARIVQVKRLGAGAQGEVWLCKDEAQQQQQQGDTPTHKKNRSSYYVAKRMMCDDDAAALGKYQQSVRLMALQHVHLVQYLAVQKLPSAPPIVTVLMPYYSEGDVGQLIRNTRTKFSETYLCSLSLQLATALEFLHSRTPPIIHGDIKPENILLFNNREQVVLMDLDAAMELSGVGAKSHVATVKVGTTAWMAPEALHKAKGTILSDMWSLGLVMFVLAVLPDFPMLHCAASNAPELMNSLSWEARDFDNRVGSAVIGRGYTMELAQVIVRMLSHDMKRRPVARQLMERLTLIMTNQLVS